MKGGTQRKVGEEGRARLELRPCELQPWARDLIPTQLLKVSVAKLHQAELSTRLLLSHVAR